MASEHLLHPLVDEWGGRKYGSASELLESGKRPPSVLTKLRTLFLGSAIWPLLGFVPLAFAASSFSWPPGLLFTFSFIGLIPLVNRLEFVTTQLAQHTNPTLGGLLTSTMSNVEEVVVILVALRGGQHRLIQLSLLGSIFGNLLLGLGLCFICGGIVRREVEFNRHVALTNCCALGLATFGLMFPCLMIVTSAELHPGVSMIFLSRLCSLLLLVAYACYIYFHLVTHKDLFEGTDGDGDDDGGTELVLGFSEALLGLVAVTVVLSFLCDFLVNSVQATSDSWGIPYSGLCVVVLPLVNNVAEHGAAVVFATKGQMDIAISIAVGAAVQITMLLFPIAVLAGWPMGVYMHLNFHAFDAPALFLTVLATVFTLHEGNANWFKGAMLVFLYAILSAAYFNHKDT